MAGASPSVARQSRRGGCRGRGLIGARCRIWRTRVPQRRIDAPRNPSLRLDGEGAPREGAAGRRHSRDCWLRGRRWRRYRRRRYRRRRCLLRRLWWERHVGGGRASGRAQVGIERDLRREAVGVDGPPQVGDDGVEGVLADFAVVQQRRAARPRAVQPDGRRCEWGLAHRRYHVPDPARCGPLGGHSVRRPQRHGRRALRIVGGAQQPAQIDRVERDRVERLAQVAAVVQPEGERHRERHDVRRVGQARARFDQDGADEGEQGEGVLARVAAHQDRSVRPRRVGRVDDALGDGDDQIGEPERSGDRTALKRDRPGPCPGHLALEAQIVQALPQVVERARRGDGLPQVGGVDVAL